MFKLQRHSRQAKSGERIDFKFSNFQAIQVPKGWDKLFVSVISVETGRTIAKSSKSQVRNGNCQWSETFSEPLWASRDDSQKALEDHLLKFVVSTVSARSGILGEATVNMSGYMSSKASVPVFLPLKKCNYGTVLQVKIQCLNPNAKLRGQELKHSESPLDDQITDPAEVECRSYGSEDSFARNSESCSSKDLGSASLGGEAQSRQTSFSESGSHHSFGSPDNSVGREIFSLNNELNGGKDSPVGRQDSISSVTSSPHNNHIAEKPSHSAHSSFNTRTTGSVNDSQWRESVKRSSHFAASTGLANSNSSKTFLEAAEETIDELRAEAKKWERSARKLMLDMEILRKDFSNQSIKQADKEMELSAAYAECDGLKKEIEQLKLAFEQTMLKQTGREDSTFQLESGIHIQKELENEIKFQKEYTTDLAVQLKRSQESNIELVTVLQELEEIIEKQKGEIEKFSAPQCKFTDDSTPRNQALLDIEMEYELKLSAKEEEIASLKSKLAEPPMNKQSDDSRFCNGCETDLNQEVKFLKEKLQEVERDCSELTTENLELLFKLKSNCLPVDSSSCKLPVNAFPISESEMKELKPKIYDLEEELKETMIENDKLPVLGTDKLFPDLVEQLQKAFYHVKRPWYNISSLVNDDFGSEIPELADFNGTDVAAPQGKEDSIVKFVIKLNQLLERKIIQCEEVLKHCEGEIREHNDEITKAQKIVEEYILKEKNLCLLIRELENSNADLQAHSSGLDNQLKEKLDEIKKLEESLLLKEVDIDFHRECAIKLEAQISDIGNEKIQLEEKLELVQRENSSHVLTNQNLEKLCTELERQKQELELRLDEVDECKTHLSGTMASLEAQLKDLTDEKETYLSDIEKLKSVSTSLKEEIKVLEIEMETEKTDLKQKLQDIQNQLLESQQECEKLKLSNQMLQSSAESLIEECNSFEKENQLLREGKSELLEHCTDLDTELRKSQEICSDYSKKVQAFEENLSSVLEDFSLREKKLSSEIDALLEKNRKQNEKLVLAENLSNQLLLEKTIEVENLQMEIGKLKGQLSICDDDSERIASEFEEELSSLRASKANLESTLHEVQSKVKLAEDEIDDIRTESELKVNGLMVELSTSRRNHESLRAEHEKITKLLANYRSSEVKLKTNLNDIELKLTVSEYERQKLSEEMANLKVQLQKLIHFEEEMIALKSELNVTKSEKEKLKAALLLASEECEDLKIEKIAFVQKISCFQTAMSEFEECKKENVVLGERLQQMKNELSTRLALCADDANLKHEIGQIKRDNRELLSKMQQLEVEKDEWMKNAQALEEQLKLVEEQKKNCSQSLENELAQALEANNRYQSQLQRLLSEGISSKAAAPSPRKSMGDSEIIPKEKFERTKSSLEAELRDIRERYFQMSLKYAEVEAQREDLVMKLKASKSGSKWFS